MWLRSVHFHTCFIILGADLWPAQTENLEIGLLFAAQPFMTANKKCTPSIPVVISFLRYAIFDSRTVTVSNKFWFLEKANSEVRLTFCNSDISYSAHIAVIPDDCLSTLKNSG